MVYTAHETTLNAVAHRILAFNPEGVNGNLGKMRLIGVRGSLGVSDLEGGLLVAGSNS